MAQEVKIETKRLTDTFVRSRKAAPKGERKFWRSADHKRVLLCVTDKLGPDNKPYKSFLYGTVRFPGSNNPTRRELGTYPTMSIADAHKKAREWDVLIDKGVDPRTQERREEEEQAKQRSDTVASRAAKYLTRIKDQRQAKETERIINKHLLPGWGPRPIGDITPSDVKWLIEGVTDGGHTPLARNVLTVCKSFFDWALDEDSPAAALRPKKLFGKKKPRQRTLNDNELRAFWKGTSTLSYPYRDLYRLLLLTGVRLREGAGARWSEIDMKQQLWTIPPERFKSDATHLVPLSGMAMQLLEELPRFRDGDCLFSHDAGRHPVNSFSKAKERLDIAMTDELGRLEPWVVHDLRRVVRTGLASLKVPDSVAELVIGHGHGNALQRTYDLHQRLDELRDALEQWAGKVRDIVEPPPANVRKLRRAG
jgi:integrase